jgi:hypothetical protein
MTEVLRSLNPQGLTASALSQQKVENCRLGVLALVKLVTKATGAQEQKKYLAACLKTFPCIEEHIVDHTFRNHKMSSRAIDAFGACLVLRGLHQFDETGLKDSCLAVLQKVRGDTAEEAEAGLEQVMEVDPEVDVEVEREQRRYALAHLAALSSALREQAVSANALLSLVPTEDNRRRATEAVDALSDHVSRTEGRYDALALLTDVHGLSYEEALPMATSYGKFLRAAALSCGCTPPTKEMWFSEHCSRQVPHYDPRHHGHVINAAFESFKQGAVYQRYAEPKLERLREQPRRAMRARDIGLSHSRPPQARLKA